MFKFSVKKPLTVLVGVVIVLILGVVSILKMTPDLMPDMDMPYVMIMTTYAGATPEEVEETVTKPMEQAMSTLEHISEVSSTSSANYSMITLEFTEDVNMDTISVDILQKINTLSDDWSSAVGTPYILKINPTMIPVTVSAVSMDGNDTAALSEFMDQTLMNKLEGITGVASVTANGTLDQTVSVILSQTKIDALNEKIARAVEGQFAESEAQLQSAQNEVTAETTELESGKTKLSTGETQLANQAADAQGTIDNQQQELTEGRSEIESQLQSIETQLSALTASETTLRELQSALQELVSAQSQMEASIQQMQALQQTIQSLEATQSDLNAQMEAIQKDASLSEAEKSAKINEILNSTEYKQTVAGLAAIDTQLQVMGLTRSSLPTAITAAETSLAQVNAQLAQLDSTLSAMGVSRSDVTTALNEISDAIAQLESARAQLSTLLTELDRGEIQLAEAKKQLEVQKINSIFQLSTASAQLIAGESTLKNAQTQVDSGLEQLQSAKETALESTDLNNILTMDTVSKILAAQNFSMPAGYVQENGIQYLVSVGDKVRSQEELDNLVLLDLGLDGVDPIRLSDVADVFLTDNSDSVYANINGSSGILLSFTKQSTYATATVADNINAKFAELEEEYPGLHFDNLMDQGNYIHTVIQSILQSLLLGALFAAIILFLFLRDIKPTLIVVISIPISVLFAFILMYFSGVTLNMISMSGLAVAVGMLVDNSVVVIENIYRLRNKGVSAIKSAIIGASQVAAAIASSTLTTICVFFPIVFVQGLTRQLFTDMALTMAFSLLASLVVALTLVPAMSSRMLRKPPKEHKHRFFRKAISFYESSLRWSLRFKPVVLIAAVVLLVGSGALVLSRGFIFMPESSSSEISLTLEMPETAVLEDTRKTADEAIRRIQQMEDVELVGGILTSGNGSSLSIFGAEETSVRNVMFYVTLKDGASKTGKQVSKDILDAVSDLDGEFKLSDTMSSSGMMSMLSDDGITVRVYGEDLQELQASAKEIAARLESVEGTTEVSNGIDDTDPEIQFVVDKQKAAAYGLTVAQVYQEIASALQTESTATTVTFDSSSYDVVVHRSAGSTLTPQQLKNYTFTVDQTDGSKKTVSLQEIAAFEETESLSSIQRIHQKRYLEVTAEVADGYNVSLVTESVKSALEGLSLPTNCSYEFNGGSEDILSSIQDLIWVVLLGILLVYLIMVAQFQSIKHPFIIMFTIPLALTGGLLALLVTGMEISVISMIGFVMLCGIIVNNGIVLVDFINQLRLAGVPKKEALVEAGKTRIRPILMTSITTILGLMIMALGIGEGNQMMQPIAIVCIGGLLYGTLLTLYVVPILYDLMNRKDLKRVTKEDLDISVEEMMDEEFSDYLEQRKAEEPGVDSDAESNDPSSDSHGTEKP